MERAEHPGHVAQRRRPGEAVVAAAGRLALEVEDQPAGVDLDHLGEVEVAVDADLGAGVVDARGPRRAGPAPRRRRAAAAPAAPATSVEAARPSASTHAAASPGCAPHASAIARCSSAITAPSRAGVGREVAAALLGRQPRREHVADRRAGELPALGGAHEEVAQHREVHVVAAQLGDRRQHVLVAALGEHPRDLDVGVRAGLDLAEHLEDRALVEHHRAVGVLEHDRPAHLHLAVGRHQVEHGDGEVGVDERVVEHDVVAVAVGHHGEQLALLALEELGPRVRPAGRR